MLQYAGFYIHDFPILAADFDTMDYNTVLQQYIHHGKWEGKRPP